MGNMPLMYRNSQNLWYKYSTPLFLFEVLYPPGRPLDSEKIQLQIVSGPEFYNFLFIKKSTPKRHACHFFILKIRFQLLFAHLE